MVPQIVAVDGLPGSGKTSLARELAAQLALSYVGTGAIFRAFTMAAISAGVRSDSDKFEAFLSECKVKVRGGSIVVNGMQVSDEDLRTLEVRRHVSAMAALPTLRKAVLRVERESLGDTPRCVMEGQDIGTVVVPDAPVKLFLVARRDVRQRRRQEESGLSDRDRNDATRRDAPLAIAHDAFVVDTSELGIAQLVERVVPICHIHGVGN